MRATLLTYKLHDFIKSHVHLSRKLKIVAFTSHSCLGNIMKRCHCKAADLVKTMNIIAIVIKWLFSENRVLEESICLFSFLVYRTDVSASSCNLYTFLQFLSIELHNFVPKKLHIPSHFFWKHAAQSKFLPTTVAKKGSIVLETEGKRPACFLLCATPTRAASLATVLAIPDWTDGVDAYRLCTFKSLVAWDCSSKRPGRAGDMWLTAASVSDRMV